MNHYVIDYETIINCVVACFEHYKTEETKVFVIHKSKNQVKELLNFLNQNAINNELNSYKGSEISTIKRMIYMKMESMTRNQKIGSLMNEIYSHSLQHRHIIPIDYSRKEIQELIKFIDYDKEIKSNFDFERFQRLNKQLNAHVIYEKKKRDEYYRKMREEEREERERTEKESGIKLMEKYGKKPTCSIS